MIPRQKLSVNKKVDFTEAGFTPQSERTNSKIELAQEDILEPEIIEPFDNHNDTFIDKNPVQVFPSMYHQKKTQEQDYQEMLIVRHALDFDERQFRDHYIRTESEIILKMRSKHQRHYHF